MKAKKSVFSKQTKKIGNDLFFSILKDMGRDLHNSKPHLALAATDKLLKRLAA
jgi:hypothetical protein